MKKKMLILVLIVMSICSGCNTTIIRDGKEVVVKDEAMAIGYIYDIKSLEDLEYFCKINNYSFPPKDPYVSIVLTSMEMAAYTKYREFKPSVQQIIAMNENKRKLQWKKAKQFFYNNRIIGMTTKEIQDNMGLPWHGINRTVGSWGVHEQWIYGKAGIRGVFIGNSYHSIPDTYGPYIYFENGIVTSYQN